MADYDDDAGIKIAIVSDYGEVTQRKQLEIRNKKQVKLRLTKTSRGKKALGKIGFELVLSWF